MVNVLRKFARHYLLALQFFTRIPVTGRLADWVGYSPGMLRASAGHFPGVGVVVGALIAGLTASLMVMLPTNVFTPLVAAVVGTAFGVLITGAFHEDGLADVFDGLGGTHDKERALIIMKDSRVGAFGAIAVTLTLFLKVALLSMLGTVSMAVMCGALFLAHVVSRFWPLLIIRLMPHVGDAAGSKSKPLADQISGASLMTALVWVVLAMAGIAYLNGVGGLVNQGYLPNFAASLAIAICSSGMAFFVLSRWFWARLQGFTGDCLGTTQQIGEVALYLGLAMSL